MRGEILGVERRRRWSDEEKLSIVLSVGVNGATVSQVAWRAPIGWSGLIVSALSASGPSERCFRAQAGDTPMRCVV